MNVIDKLIQIAENEVGYLEKKSNSSLYDKTANAGKNNYTKYWAEIKPDYQGEPWCACFVTWCFVKAFGQAAAKKLLKHYPYVYCPTMSGLFTLHANPKRGDIVIFKRSGRFAHTGIVTGVNGDYFTTIEGNTSGGSTIIANGGGVCAKGYYNSKLPGTKFCRPDYDIIEKESEDREMTSTERKEFEALKQEIAELRELVSERDGYFNYIDANMPESYKPTIRKLMGRDILLGNENGELMLTTDMMRILTILDRTGVFG